MRSEMRRRRDYEMALKNSWRRKENNSDQSMRPISRGDWSHAPDWGMWQHCGSFSGAGASMGGYPRGRPWRGVCWRLQGMGTSKGRSRRSYLDSGWRRKEGSFSPWYEDRIGFSQSPWRSCERKRRASGCSGHRQESCMRWQPARERSHGRKWNALHWQHYHFATCYTSEKRGRPTGACWANWYSAEKRAAHAGIQVQDVGQWADRWLRFVDEERRKGGGKWCSGVQLFIPERIRSPVGRIGRWDEPEVLALAWAPTWRRSTGMGSWGWRSPLAAHGRVAYTIIGGLVCNAHSRLGIRESTTTASPSTRRRGTQSCVWGVVSPSVVGYVGPKRNP